MLFPLIKLGLLDHLYHPHKLMHLKQNHPMKGFLRFANKAITESSKMPYKKAISTLLRTYCKVVDNVGSYNPHRARVLAQIREAMHRIVELNDVNRNLGRVGFFLGGILTIQTVNSFISRL